MADPDTRITEAFEAFRTATARQVQPAGRGTRPEAVRRRRRWRGYWVAVVAALVVLVPSGITIGLTEAASRRTAPLPSPSASAPVPNPTTTNPTVVNPSDLPDCG